MVSYFACFIFTAVLFYVKMSVFLKFKKSQKNQPGTHGLAWNNKISNRELARVKNNGHEKSRKIRQKDQSCKGKGREEKEKELDSFPKGVKLDFTRKFSGSRVIPRQIGILLN